MSAPDRGLATVLRLRRARADVARGQLAAAAAAGARARSGLDAAQAYLAASGLPGDGFARASALRALGAAGVTAAAGVLRDAAETEAGAAARMRQRRQEELVAEKLTERARAAARAAAARAEQAVLDEAATLRHARRSAGTGAVAGTGAGRPG